MNLPLKGKGWVIYQNTLTKKRFQLNKINHYLSFHYFDKP